MSFAYKYLDGEQLYRVYWVEMGEARSIKRLASWCSANGLKNKRTGKPSYRDWETDRKSTRLNSSHRSLSRMPSSA